MGMIIKQKTGTSVGASAYKVGGGEKLLSKYLNYFELIFKSHTLSIIQLSFLPFAQFLTFVFWRLRIILSYTSLVLSS